MNKWNPQIAYAVGLITTDGNLSSDGRHLELTSNDIQLLQTFKKFLKIDNKITPKLSGYTKKKNAFRVQFGDVAFYKWLIEIGLMPNKTKRVGKLKIADGYFFHFLRGHLDGDGSVQKFQDPVYPNSQRLYVHFNSASLKHLKWLRLKIKRLSNIKGFIRKGIRMYTLTYAKKESLILLPRIYPNPRIPCLKRKYKIVQELIRAPRW